ncbi:uncharacterized protein LOC111866550 isoform X3 [Cryptotermes secundus]|uniref:uncharacterized protein LOC111866550 isoform X3 n=1 Tax=Cryptotermes secundus TaxID=105785 RepID=UPI000CD7BBE8|nr:uncharacterized protein LOC111866550 isoform X3 [Cryptotermes secundus]
MAYVNVAEWKPEQVTEWLKGLDNAILLYVHSFLNNEVNGQQLLNLRPDDLDHLGVHKLGHQELILEAVEHLRNFHYELDRENLQLLALRLSCRAHSLHNELRQETDSRPVSTQTLADVATVITAVKPLVCWLDRSPFTGQLDYQDRKTELLKLSLAIATCAQRDRFAERPVEEIRSSCKELARMADSIIQDIVDPLILQPASLDLATLKKRAGDDLGFFILPSFQGLHQISEIKFSSPAHQCGKIEEGDEVVQVNYQTVVGWQTKRVMALFEESPTDVFLTLKKRPRHTKVYGQIYMKPYRLPSKKRAAPYSRWHDNLPSPRPELLTIPDFEMPLPRALPKQTLPQPELGCEPLASNSSSDDDDDSFLPGAQDEGQTSPTSMRLYLPKPRVTVQRRATVTGASPTNKRPPVNIEQFWRELRLERQWKDGGPFAGGELEGRKDELYQLRDKSASFGNDLSVSPPTRPTTCLGIENSCNRLKTGKTLRITESRDDMHAVEDCEETPHNSMESMKENIVYGKETSEREEDCRETGNEVQKKRLSNQNQENVHFEGRNDNEDNDTSQRGISVLCVSNNGVNSIPKNEESERQGDEHSERWDEETGRTGYGNKACAKQGSQENDGPESSSREILPHKPYSDDTSDRRDQHLTQDNVKCDARTGDSILRVKGGGYGLPSDDLTDVFDGVEEIDKVHRHKNSVTSIESTVLVQRERGRLDKSYSTPAYDLTDCDQVQDRSGKIYLVEDWTNCHVPENSCSLLSPASEISPHSVFQVEKEIHAVSKSEASLKTASKRNSESSDASIQDGDSFGLEDKQTQRIGEILETINVALLQHRLKEHNNDNKASNSNNAAEHTDLLSHRTDDVPLGKEDSETDARLYVPSNECIGSQHVACSALLQEKSNKDSEVLSESNVADSHQDQDLPHSAPDLSTAQRESEVWQKMTVPEVSVKHPHTDEKQESVVLVSQTGVSHITICVTPPEPPPRPDHAKGGGSMGYRAIMAARSLGRNTGNKSLVGGGHATFPSPRSLRKRNPLLTKKRNVSVRDLGVGDREGWLLHRCRSGGAGAVWLRAWFVLKSTIFYGFKTPQSTKADIMISLPGFTASLADEVKSRKFAFKVYHTGTAFYFAVESEDELPLWMESITLATLKQDFSETGQESEAVFFSETDEEPESDMDTETCFPSPKMSKFVGFLSSNNSQQHEKQSFRSHQNLATESKSQESQKKFGSLRKLGRKTNEQNSSSSNQETSGTVTVGSSLDRKYLRFLGGRNNIVPVPTSQFRSYRRVPNGPAPTPQSKAVRVGQKEQNISRGGGCEQEIDNLKTSAQDPSVNMPLQQKSPAASETAPSSANNASALNSSSQKESHISHDTRPLLNSLNEMGPAVSQEMSIGVRGERMFKPQDRVLPLPVKRHLKVDFRDRQIHSSNPSLQFPSDMADYRLAAERLRQFGIRRNEQREDTSGFVTLKQFMLSRQEEERRQCRRAVQRPVGSSEVYTGYTEDPLCTTEAAGPSRNNSWSSSKTRHGGPAAGPSVARQGSFNGSKIRRNNSSDLTQESQGRQYRGGSPEKLWINSLRRNDMTRKPSEGSCKNSTPDHGLWNPSSLKRAAQYQPPPVSQSMASSRNVHTSEEAPRMKFAFEMHLGNNRSPTSSDKEKDSPPSKSSKFRNLFSSKQSHHQKQNFLELSGSHNSHRNQHKAILGSPRLHRAIFRDKKNHGTKSSSTSDSSSSSVNSPTSAVLCDWSTGDYGSQTNPNMAQFKDSTVFHLCLMT